MADYIKREDAREKLCSMCRWEGTENCGECEHPIDDIPAADVVEVVRCKDCKHNRGVVTDMWGNPAVQCDYEIDYKPLDWYCAAGEKE